MPTAGTAAPARRRAEAIAAELVESPSRIPAAFEALGADRANVRYGHSKALRLLAKDHPELLYEYFDTIAELLGSKYRILQWDAQRLLAELARVDTADKTEGILHRYLAPITGPDLVTAANAIIGGGQIGRAKPQLADRVARRILAVERARYATPECGRVAAGHAITALGELFDSLQDRQAVIAFVRRQLRCTRASTRSKAARFLARHDLDLCPDSEVRGMSRRGLRDSGKARRRRRT